MARLDVPVIICGDLNVDTKQMLWLQEFLDIFSCRDSQGPTLADHQKRSYFSYRAKISVLGDGTIDNHSKAREQPCVY